MKKALSLKFGGLEELGEKMCIIGELGKLLLEEIPLEETPPGYGRARYIGYEKTENAVNEASKCVGYSSLSLQLRLISNSSRRSGSAQGAMKLDHWVFLIQLTPRPSPHQPFLTRPQSPPQKNTRTTQMMPSRHHRRAKGGTIALTTRTRMEESRTTRMEGMRMPMEGMVGCRDQAVVVTSSGKARRSSRYKAARAGVTSCIMVSRGIMHVSRDTNRISLHSRTLTLHRSGTVSLHTTMSTNSSGNWMQTEAKQSSRKDRSRRISEPSRNMRKPRRTHPHLMRTSTTSNRLGNR